MRASTRLRSGSSWRAESGCTRWAAEGGVERFEHILSAVQERVEVMAPRHRSVKERTILDGVSLEDRDVLEVVGQDSRGEQARDAAADDDRAISEATHASV